MKGIENVKVVRADDVEGLAGELVAALKAERSEKGRFETLKASVANPNLGNWLKMKVFAKTPELCAGVELPFLTDTLEEIVLENAPAGTEIVSGRDYPPIVLNILLSDANDAFAPFRDYVKETQEGTDQAGGRVSSRTALTIFSQREARRAVSLATMLGDLIDAYESTGALGLLREKSQAGDANAIYRGEQALVDAMAGVSSLRRVFESVKGTSPKGEPRKVYLFGQTNDVLTPLQREILAWVAQTHEVVWFRPECAAGDGTTALPKTVRVVGTPGIRREVEFVYDEILKSVWKENVDGKPVKKEGISFSDIAVLVADMPTYRPMIESVFDGRGQIPFGLIDATTQDYSVYLDGFLALMDLARYGLNRTRLFAALDNACVQRAMGFSRDDVDAWRELAKATGAFDGFEPADSDEKNVSGRFDWSWALQRLRLGLVAEKVDGLTLEARDARLVAKFSEVVETLHRRLSALNGVRAFCASDDASAWPKTWAGRLHAIMDEFLAADVENELEVHVRASIVRTLNGLTAIRGEQGYRLPVAFVEASVAGVACAKGGYLRHGVTIGGLRSLAHVPFKKIFVIGLNEGKIPAREIRSTLDVRNELSDEERKENGETLKSDESVARFYAAVASAREELVLSYQRVDLQKDAKLYPSPLIEEVVGKGYEVEKCPFEDETLTAEANEERSKDGGRWDARPTGDGASMELSAADYAAMVRDPFMAVWTQRFKIAKADWRNATLEAASPLGASGNTGYALEDAVVRKKLTEEFEEAKERGNVPANFLGAFVEAQLQDGATWAEENVSTEDRELLEKGGENEERTVICRHFSVGNNESPITIPPSCVVWPLYRALSRFVGTQGTDDFKFSVTVIATKRVVERWNWCVSREQVVHHLEGLKAWYGEIPPTIDLEEYRSGQWKTDFGYDALRRKLKTFDNAAKADADEWNVWANGLSVVSGGLVIDRALSKHQRTPDGAELKRMFDEIFSFAMSGKLTE
jgi:hypothetical protein